MKIYSENFDKLILLLPSLLSISGAFSLTATGAGNVDVQVVRHHANKIEMRLAHRLALLDGSFMPDPVVTVAVFPLAQTAGALTYEDCFGHRNVYCDRLMAFSPLAQRDLNNLLGEWLTKLLAENRQMTSVDGSGSSFTLREQGPL